jgi:two-component system, chemotaxis family, sensor kinase CheA
MSDAEIVREFLIESYENLDRLDRDLICLEKDPSSQPLLASIFRTIHTIKGTSGFLSFSQLESVTHVGESLLARLRDGALTLTPEITSALLAMVDAVRQMLGNIETSGSEGERDDAALVANLTGLLQAGRAEESASPPPAPPPAPAPAPAEAESRSAANLGDILMAAGKAKVSQVWEAVEQQKAGDPRRVGEILVENGVVKPQDVLSALQTQQQARQNASESTIRVGVGQLDALMNRVGELVLLRNQIVQFTNAMEGSPLQGAGQRLNLLTSELQESVMKTRMQPIGNIWSKFPRTVRDVAMNCGKQVRIEMEGEDTELDKTIVEAIKDPLTHLVRNAVDHGIEPPERRRAAGKDSQGCLRLRALHEGGQVKIEISDDGSGLDLEKIRNKAVDKGLITEAAAERMSEREIGNLIFLPGLSTAEKVSNVSGRGVGMDVVKTNIERIGGTVELQSRPGQGSTVRMKIPLTLAIVPALILTADGERYAIPQISLLELVRLEGESLRSQITAVHSAPVYRLRGRLLPLVNLRDELKSGAKAPAPSSEHANIVVLQADDRQFGLVVDEINDTEEIVVKPLGKQLKRINVYAGATIMGDGRVALILDVLGLAQRADVLGEVRERAVVSGDRPAAAAEAAANRAVLLFSYGQRGRMAVDLGLVARLEEFPSDAVERAGGQEVVQYRGQIMPLVRVSDVLEPEARLDHLHPGHTHLGQTHLGQTHPNHPHPSRDWRASLSVVVYADQQRRVGLVVDRILDIVEDTLTIESHSSRRGVLGSAVIQARVTDILDVPGLLAAAGELATAAEAGA